MKNIGEEIWDLSGEWEFSGEEIIKRRNVLDLNEEGTFVAYRVTKEAETWAFALHGELDGLDAVLEFVLDQDSIENPDEMTAGEIISLPWENYVIWRRR